MSTTYKQQRPTMAKAVRKYTLASTKLKKNLSAWEGSSLCVMGSSKSKHKAMHKDKFENFRQL